MPSHVKEIQLAKQAFRAGQQLEAIRILEAFCQEFDDLDNETYVQAQMELLKIYQYAEDFDQAVAICQRLANSCSDPKTKTWASQKLTHLTLMQKTQQWSTAGTLPVPDSAPTPPDPRDAPTLVNPDQPTANPQHAAPLATPDQAISPLSSQPDPVASLNSSPRPPDLSSPTSDRSSQPSTPSGPRSQPTQQSSNLSSQSLDPTRQRSDRSPHISPRSEGSQDPSPSSTSSRSNRSMASRLKLQPPPELRYRFRILVGSLIGFGLVIWIGSFGFLQVVRFIRQAPWWGEGLASLSLALNGIVLLLVIAPLVLDFMQRWIFQVKWIPSLEPIETHSPAATLLISQICSQHHLKLPHLGIIPSPIPVAFSYSVLPDQARMIVSQGLLEQLTEDEIAAIYAQQLGQILRWDTLAITVISFPAQVFLLAYIFGVRFVEKRLRSSPDRRRSRQQKQDLFVQALRFLVKQITPLFYLLHLATAFPVIHLSRLGAYDGDHAASEFTGNPNAVVRALTKMAAGIQQQAPAQKDPHWLLRETRLLGLIDWKTMDTIRAVGSRGSVDSDTFEGMDSDGLPGSFGLVGTQSTLPASIQVLRWDLFNPWAKWMAINSSHPLPGKRFRILATYAERIRVDPEFGLGQLPAAGRQLDQGRLKRHFQRNLLLYSIEILGLIVGWSGGLIAYLLLPAGRLNVILGSAAVGLGLGITLKSFLVFQNLRKAVETDLWTLLADPYSTPLWGQPVRLTGELVQLGQVGTQLGSELRLQADGCSLLVQYSSRFGPLGNVISRLQFLRPLIGHRIRAIGWFRRGLSPYLDLVEIQKESGQLIRRSYPRFWLALLGALVFSLGLALIVVPRIL